MVGGVGDETFGEFVQGYREGGLEADGEEGVGGDMVVVDFGVVAVGRGGIVVVVGGFGVEGGGAVGGVGGLVRAGWVEGGAGGEVSCWCS